MSFFQIGLLISSILSSLAFKIQQKCVVDGVTFNHPLMQTTIMFISESFCLICFLFYKYKYKNSYEKQRGQEIDILGKKGEINILQFAIPSFLDFIGSFITLIAMSMMPFSFYYMVRGGNVIITAIFSIILFKRVLFKHNYVGLLMNLLGFLTVGVSSIITSETDEDSTYLIFGVVLIIVTFFTTTIQLIYEEKLFKQYYLHPLQVVGWEGIWGFLFSLIAIVIFTNVPCFVNQQNCPNGKIEDVPQFFRIVLNVKGTDQPVLLIMIIMGIIFLMFLNGFSLSVTKYENCLIRSLITGVAPFVVWLFTISIGWDEFNYGQFCGYLIITIGAMIYSEILVIPFWGMNKNIKQNKKPKKIYLQQQSTKEIPRLESQRSQLNTTCNINSQNCKIPL